MKDKAPRSTDVGLVRTYSFLPGQPIGQAAELLIASACSLMCYRGLVSSHAMKKSAGSHLPPFMQGLSLSLSLSIFLAAGLAFFVAAVHPETRREKF